MLQCQICRQQPNRRIQGNDLALFCQRYDFQCLGFIPLALDPFIQFKLNDGRNIQIVKVAQPRFKFYN